MRKEINKNINKPTNISININYIITVLMLFLIIVEILNTKGSFNLIFYILFLNYIRMNNAGIGFLKKGSVNKDSVDKDNIRGELFLSYLIFLLLLFFVLISTKNIDLQPFVVILIIYMVSNEYEIVLLNNNKYILGIKEKYMINFLRRLSIAAAFCSFIIVIYKNYLYFEKNFSLIIVYLCLFLFVVSNQYIYLFRDGEKGT